MRQTAAYDITCPLLPTFVLHTYSTSTGKMQPQSGRVTAGQYAILGLSGAGRSAQPVGNTQNCLAAEYASKISSLLPTRM